MEKTTSRVKARYTPDKLLPILIKKGLYILSAYLCGICALPFGATPFGFAFLAAVGNNAPFVYIGLVISAFSSFELPLALLYFGVYTCQLLLRVLVRLTLAYPFSRGERVPPQQLFGIIFSEPIGYRLLSSLVSSAAFSILLTVGGGLLYYDLVGLFLSTVCAPFAAYMFYCALYKNGIWQKIGFLVICGIMMYAAIPLKIYGISLAVACGIMLVFYVSERSGFIFGVLCSAVIGLIFSPTLAPIFIFAALASAVFIRISPSLVCISTFFCATAWGFFVRGISALDGLFGGILAACLLYSVIYRLYMHSGEAVGRAGTYEEKKKQSIHTCTVLDISELDSVRLYETNRRMWAISDGLERLSEFFEELRLSFPKYGELLRICREAFDSSCVGCPEYASCSKDAVEKEIRHLASLLENEKCVDRLLVSRELSEKCTRLPDIIDEINYNSGVCISKGESYSFAPDYKALSRLLTKSLEDEGPEYTIDTELSAALCSALSHYKCAIGAFVYGKRQRVAYIKGENAEILEQYREQILSASESTLPFKLDRERTEIRKSTGGAVLLAREAENITVSFVTKQRRARGEAEFCGDSLTLFHNSDSRFFSLLSDGMGSGRDAAAISKICTSFICSMLDTGRMNGELMEWLNGFLCGRCVRNLRECSATVDLMELDLISGSTVFFKSGAAPTYVWRDGGLIKLRCRTMPIGILEHTDTKRFELELRPGDVVVMLSDGVCPSSEECPWLFDLLRQNINSASPERTADLIVKYAVAHGSDDDISVAIMEVFEK